MTVEAAYKEALRCNKCGFCQSVCPVYRVSGRESRVARGHNAHLRALVEGTLRMDEPLLGAAADCLLCRNCVTNCFPAVKTDEIVLEIRRSFRPESALERFVFRGLLPNPNRFASYLRVLYGASGLGSLARKLGILPWLGRALAKATEMGEPAPHRFLRDSLHKIAPPAEPVGKIHYFVSCGFNFAVPETGVQNLRLLSRLGFEVNVLPNCCCGLPAFAHGDFAAARSLALKNAPLLEGTVIVDCASCYSFLLDYGKHFGIELRARILDISEFVAECADGRLDSLFAPGGESGPLLPVTYHEPCHFARYHRPASEPRTLLGKIPGVEFREMKEADWCCGAAGFYSVAHARESDEILARKIRNVRATGARTLVTACPACILQLSYGVRKAGLDVRVMHVAEFALHRATGMR